MKWAFPFFSHLSAAVLFGLAFFPKILQHGVDRALQSQVAFSDSFFYFEVNAHVAQFFKLVVQVENNCRERALPRFSLTVWVHPHDVKSFPCQTKTKVVTLRVFAHF